MASLDKLMNELINGNKSAFEDIYALTRKSVYYTALSVLKERSLAEDVMQSTYLNVLRCKSSYRSGTNAAAWINRIARNEALNLKKSRNREEYMDENGNLPLFGTEEQSDYGFLIDLARRTLADDEFAILMYITACGYKRREIGRILDMPVSTVTWKYNGATNKLRKLLKEEK